MRSVPSRSVGSLMAAGVATIAAVGSPAAQQLRPLITPPAFVIHQWTTEDGLPQNSVNAIAQTPDGYLWIGTFGGLVRFDGTTFRLEERIDRAGRHVDRVLALAVDTQGALWIGTENGLLRYRNQTYDRFTQADGVPGEGVAALHVDRSGTLWVGAPDGGIARLTDGRLASVHDTDGQPLRGIVSFVEDTDGTLWINAGPRFFTVRAQTGSARAERGPQGVAAVLFALEDRAGARWYSTPDGVVRVSDNGVRRYGTAEGIRSAVRMVEDPGGGFWLGTNNEGLFYLDPDGDRAGAQRYALPDGRDQYRVRAAFVDIEGNVWFGTNADGLLRAKRNLFTTFTSEHGLSHDVATAVYADAGGIVWAATNCFGLNAIDEARGTVRLYKPRKPGDPTGDPCVFAVTESPPGTVWAGTYGGGLTRVTRGREEWLRSLELPDSVVLALFTDRDGVVWIGTNAGGLARLQGGRVGRTYTTEDGLAHNAIRSLYQTRDGALWIGTMGGLSRLEGDRIVSYTAAEGLSAEHVRALHEDADGNLWIGTYGGGLNRLRDGVFVPITRRDGLGEDVVSAILEDRRGYFWMSGNRGITRVARQELLAFAEERLRRVHSVTYGEGDGLRNAETNGGFQPAATRDARGRLWFPTVHGVAVVDPERVNMIDHPPAVSVEEVIVDGVAQAPTNVVAGPGGPNLEFRYAGLSLSAPEHVTYRYRLEGYDRDWIDAGSRRVAYYPRLPQGRYRFVVTAANRDGIWNATGATLDLRVAAPFWSTWWFRGVVALGLLGAVGTIGWRRELGARRRRAAQEEFSRLLLASQEHERKRIAGELHDGLGQELLVVKNRALLALRSNSLDGAREQLQQITDVVTQSLDTVRGLAHNLTPYQLDHLGVTAALRAMVEAVAEPTDITLDVGVDDIDGLLPVDGEINLYRIVQEGLSNVVHHADATAAGVHVRRAGDVIAVTIMDNGRGFAVERDARGGVAGGFGLSGIAERVRILGGRVDVVSALRRGTRLEVSVPIRRTAKAGDL